MLPSIHFEQERFELNHVLAEFTTGMHMSPVWKDDTADGIEGETTDSNFSALRICPLCVANIGDLGFAVFNAGGDDMDVMSMR